MRVTWSAVGDIEVPLRGHRVNETVVVGGQATARLPNGCQTVIGVGIEHTSLLQRGGVVAQHPGIVTVIAVIGAEGEVDNPIDQQQAWPIQLVQTIKIDNSSGVAGDGGTDGDGASRPVFPGSEIDGAQLLPP